MSNRNRRFKIAEGIVTALLCVAAVQVAVIVIGALTLAIRLIWGLVF